MSPIKEVKVAPLKRQFPHVDGVEDWSAKQTIRLLWDRIFDVEGRLQAAEATLTRLTDATNTQETELHAVSVKADQALASAEATRAETQQATTGSKDDQGKGAAGCAAAVATHVGPFSSTDLTVQNAGRVICGVGLEWASLLVATSTKATRDTNRDTLLNRMVWHLNLAGFRASRYPTTDGRPWHILFDAVAIDGSLPVRQHGYRVTQYDPPYNPPSVPWDTTNVMTVCMCAYDGSSPGVTTTPDAGTPD